MAHYALAYDRLPVGVWVCDRDENVVFVNRHLLELVGRDAHEVLNRSLEEFITTILHPSHTNSFMYAFRDCSSQHVDLTSIEVKTRTASGVYKWTMWSAQPLLETELDIDCPTTTSLQGYTCTVIDASAYEEDIERRHNNLRTQMHLSAIESEINQALSEQMSTQRLERTKYLTDILFSSIDQIDTGMGSEIQESFSECVVFTDDEMVVRYANGLYKIYFGGSAGVGNGATISDIISDPEVLDFVLDRVNILIGGEFPLSQAPPLFEVTWNQSSRFFQDRVIHAHFVPYCEKQGEPPVESLKVCGFGVCLFDITEQKDMAARFEDVAAPPHMATTPLARSTASESSPDFATNKASPMLPYTSPLSRSSSITVNTATADTPSIDTRSLSGSTKSNNRSLQGVEGDPTLVCHFNWPAAELQYVNDKYCQFFKAAGRNDLVGTRFLSLLDERDREYTRKHLDTLYNDRMLGVMSQQQKDAAVYHKYVQARDQIKWIRWHFQLHFDKNVEEGYYFRGIGIDATKRMAAQMEIQALLSPSPTSNSRTIPTNSVDVTDSQMSLDALVRMDTDVSPALQEWSFVAWSLFLPEEHCLSDRITSPVPFFVGGANNQTGPMSGSFAPSSPSPGPHVSPFSMDDCRIHISGKCRELFGYEEQEFVDSPSLLKDIVHPDDLTVYFRCYERAVKGKTSSQVVRMLLPSGEMKWFDCKMSPIFDEVSTSTVIGIEAIAQDITEQNHAVEMIKLQTDMVESMSSGVCLIRQRDGVIVYHNPYFAKMMDYEERQLVGKHIATVICDNDDSGDSTSDDTESKEEEETKEGSGSDSDTTSNATVDKNSRRRPLYNKIYQAVSDNGKWQGEFSGRKSSGKDLWCSAQVTIFNHSVYGLVWVWVQDDVTERKLAHQAISRAREAALNSARAKSAFLACMSHEIRTPMNGVIGMVKLLFDTELTADQREFTESIEMCGSHLLQVINDILDFSKFESGNVMLEKLPLQVHLVIEEAIELAYNKTKYGNLDCVYSIQQGVPVIIEGDVTRLRQILVNLIGNALKFTKEGGVSVNVHKVMTNIDGSVVVQFSVKDTGIGIPKEKQNMLFKAFSQVEASTTREFGGTGLGLAISHKLAIAMKGNMWVESEMGKGAAFCFTVTTAGPKKKPFSFKRGGSNRMLSLKGDHKEMPASPKTPLSAKRSIDPMNAETRFVTVHDPKLTGKNILIIDDSQLTRASLVSMCFLWGAHPRAVSGQDLESILDWTTPVSADKPAASSRVSVSSSSSTPTKMSSLGMESTSPTKTKDNWVPHIALISSALVNNGTSFGDAKSPGDCSIAIAKRLLKLNPNIVCVHLRPPLYDDSLKRTDEDNGLFYTEEVLKPVRHSALIEVLRAAAQPEKKMHVQEKKKTFVMNSKLAEEYPFRLLVAEDNKINQKLIIRVLQKLGYKKDEHFTIVENGQLAFEAVTKEKFDVVFMDMEMPVMDGITATKTIRAYFDDPPEDAVVEPHKLIIIAMTANALDTDRNKCLDAGMDDYISKPISFEKVQRRMEVVGELIFNGNVIDE